MINNIDMTKQYIGIVTDGLISGIGSKNVLLLLFTIHRPLNIELRATKVNKI